VSAVLNHYQVNCLHEIFFDAAIESAQELDQYFAKHKKPIGPLHGLPISLKDQFHVKGVETHMGYVGWIGTFQGEKGTGKEKVYESEMVKELRNLGAVLYVKTAVPHTLMCGETTNNIIDYCWNPTNRNLSAGGSSGGEGALIALKGSPLGFGTDIGGSIRIPAAFNGLFGLRPSTGRLPYEGMANSFDGAPSILSVVGPLSSSSAGLKLAVKSILQTEPWQHDPRVHPIPWRSEQEETVKKLAQEKKLTFAVFKHDGNCAPHPPLKRALEETVEKLESQGHKVIEWQPPSHVRLEEICFKAWNYDGGEDAAKAFALSGEDHKPNIMYERSSVANATEIMSNQVAKRDAEKEYMEYWNSTSELTGTGRPVDAVISPLAPFAAARPNKYTTSSYSVWVNVLDYSSVIVPVTKVDKNVDKAYADFKPVSEVDEKTQATCKLSIMAFRPFSDSVQMTQRFMMEPMSRCRSCVGGWRRKRHWRFQNMFTRLFMVECVSVYADGLIPLQVLKSVTAGP
jgi:amidase